MTLGILAFALVLLIEPGPGSAADAVTLRDGSVVLGQVVEPSPRGSMLMIVRRAWAEEKLPGLAKRWESAEAPTLKQAQAQRRQRLDAWRRDRGEGRGGNDPINTWIDRELSRLAGADDPQRSTLMIARLSRGDVRSVVRRPKSSARLLRQGWLAGFGNVESMALDALKDALEGRGFVAGRAEPVMIDRLLPPEPEPDARWLTRRAATEVIHDPGLRFVGTGDTYFPESEPGALVNLAGAERAIGELKRLLDDTPPDPLAAMLDRVSGRGRVGAVVSRLEISPDMTAVRVESTLWVRGAAGRWSAAGARSVTFRPDDLGPKAGGALAEDPQVKAAFGLVESLGMGPIPDDVKRRSLQIGAATQTALHQARAAMEEALSALALPVGEAAVPGAKP